MMTDEILRQALKEALGNETFPPGRQRDVWTQIKGETTMKPRKLSVALVCALMLSLLMMGAALAAALGVFGSLGMQGDNASSANRLQKLEESAENVNFQTVLEAPQDMHNEHEKTLYDRLLSRQQDRTFDLTVHQSYFDGNKLYFSYTLQTNAVEHTQGEGRPDGLDGWTIEEPGKRYRDLWAHTDPALDQAITAWLDSHESSWYAYDSWGLGDGAELTDGTYLQILDSGEQKLDDCTLQGFQEVEVPAGYENADSLTIELSVLYGTSLYYQDETGVYWAHIAQPENRGILHIPVTIHRNGSTSRLGGEANFDLYSANAQLQLSDVDLCGTVRLLCPEEWTTDPAALHESGDALSHYVLVSNGQTLPNLDASMQVRGPGRLSLSLRFDLPQDLQHLSLRPVYFQSGEHPQEEIPLTPGTP